MNDHNTAWRLIAALARSTQLTSYIVNSKRGSYQEIFQIKWEEMGFVLPNKWVDGEGPYLTLIN